MTRFEIIGRDERSRGLYLLELASWNDWPNHSFRPDGPFAALIVGDATGVHSDTIGAIAERMLNAGCAYVSTWGPGCEFVHDVFDAVAVEDGDDKPVVMTSWHEHESLEESLWFLLNLARPDAAFGQDLRNIVVVVIGDDKRGAASRTYLEGLRR